MADLNSTTHEEVVLEGTIEAVRVIKTKSGMPMAFVVIGDADAPAELIVFPGQYEANSEAIKIGEKIKVSAVAECNEKGEVKYRVDEVLSWQSQKAIYRRDEFLIGLI